MEQARAHRCERMVYLGLYLAGDLLGAVLPPEVWQKVQSDSSVKTLAGWVYERLFREKKGPLGTLELTIFYLKLSQHLNDKAKLCFRLALTPTIHDLKSFPLPSFLSFLYYPSHLIRLLWKYSPEILGRIYKNFSIRCIKKMR